MTLRASKMVGKKVPQPRPAKARPTAARAAPQLATKPLRWQFPGAIMETLGTLCGMVDLRAPQLER